MSSASCAAASGFGINTRRSTVRRIGEENPSRPGADSLARGAGPKTWFAHLAIECHPDTNKTTWLDPVSDADYDKTTRE